MLQNGLGHNSALVTQFIMKFGQTFIGGTYLEGRIFRPAQTRLRMAQTNQPKSNPR